LSHLNKTFKNELVQLLGSDDQIVNEPESSNLLSNLFGTTSRVADTPVISVFARTINMNSVNIGGSTILERIGYFPYNREDRTPMHYGTLDSTISLIELLDGIILFYHATATNQIEKVAYIRDLMSDYIVAMSNTKNRLDSIKNLKDQESLNVQLQLVKTIDIFKKKLTEQARHMAWVRAVVFSEEKQERIVWLLKIVILTLSKTSESGNLFSFVPEFYLKVLADLIIGLKSHIHPTVSIENIANLKDLLQDIAEFLCNHFLDARIVNANSKDTLIFILAIFASNAMTLDALESVSRESRHKMVSNLLRLYENRAWSQSNWILVRFWQGHGFAFRYDKSPHISKKVGPKILNQDFIAQPISTFNAFINLIYFFLS
jgi:Kip1 ubiquitination-promoting complex protein 1